VTAEDEAVSTKRLAELAKAATPRTTVAPTVQPAPETPAIRPAAENETLAATNRLPLAGKQAGGGGELQHDQRPGPAPTEDVCTWDHATGRRATVSPGLREAAPGSLN
jgi:hypothetical protein